MKIELRKASLSDAEILWKMQKAAFVPLYEIYRDEGSPAMRAAFPHAGAVGAERDELLLYPGGWGACRSDPCAGLAG